MKKIKLITLSIFLISFSNWSFGQLSERVNSNSSFKLGTRPVEGNLGLFIGVNIQDFKDLENRWNLNSKHSIDSTKIQNVLPVISLRYYISDNNALRIGITTRRSNLKIVGSFNDPDQRPDKLTDLKFQKTKSDLYLNPGYEHHFLKSNLADVYFAATIPLGFVTEKYTEYLSGTSDYVSYVRSRVSLAYGMEAFFGIQAFIADLPLSIGFEVGTSALVTSGKKWKVDYKSVISGTSTSETYYTLDLSTDDQNVISSSASSGISSVIYSDYKDLKAKSASINGMARVTLCYYFGK